MGTHTIEHVQPFCDAVNGIRWHVRIATDFLTTEPRRAYVLQWDGLVSLYRESVPSTTTVGADHPRLTLSTRWANRNWSSRVHSPSDVRFEFVTDVSHEALDAIEEFRASGRLYARIEGILIVIFRGLTDGVDNWAEGIKTLMGDNSSTHGQPIISEPLELTRDRWCAQILAMLRPPGRHVIEVQLPLASANDDNSTAAKNAIMRLTEATEAFKYGRYSDVARISYQVLDELRKASAGIMDKYGMFAHKRINDELKALCSICNPTRHAEEPAHDGLSVDRALAQYVLVGSQNLAGLILSK